VFVLAASLGAKSPTSSFPKTLTERSNICSWRWGGASPKWVTDSASDSCLGLFTSLQLAPSWVNPWKRREEPIPLISQDIPGSFRPLFPARRAPPPSGPLLGMVERGAKVDVIDSTSDSGFGRSFSLARPSPLSPPYGLPPTGFLGTVGGSPEMDVADSTRHSRFSRSFLRIPPLAEVI